MSTALFTVRCGCCGEVVDHPTEPAWLCVGCGKPAQLGQACECGYTAVRSAERGEVSR